MYPTSEWGRLPLNQMKSDGLYSTYKIVVPNENQTSQHKFKRIFWTLYLFQNSNEKSSREYSHDKAAHLKLLQTLNTP